MSGVISDSDQTELRDEPPFPPLAYAIFVIAVLMVITFQAQLDRQLPALLVEPIRNAFEISDTQISFFQGAAFAVFYAVMGPVFGVLVDHSNRRNLILIGLIVWSAMTMASGFAQNYWQLLISRMGVGIGEAVLAPAAYSLIADYVAPRMRARALNVYMIAVAVGSGSSLLIGGFVVGAIANAPTIGIPLVGNFAPWQAIFLLVGAPGFLTALLLFFVKEPARHEVKSEGAKRHLFDYSAFLKYLSDHKQTFACLMTAQIAVQFVGNALYPWIPTFFSREYGLDIPTVGLILGLIFIGTAVMGFTFSGFISDYWAARGDNSARLRPLLYAEMAIIPFLIAWPLVGNEILSFFCLGMVMLIHIIAIGTLPTTLQEIVPNRMRGQSVTLTMMIATLLGYGLGPTATALITDWVFGDDAALKYSLVLATVPVSLIALGCAWLGMKPYGETRRELMTRELSGNSGRIGDD
ncbi:MFS transporter [Henriciella sp.]|uniref:spinster family MFS transporter n=1 Tax=Henriciella sp. TaxID=1968823 RepID=UPI0026039E8B|nr:MFS transporter [Henriciella sp.]